MWNGKQYLRDDKGMAVWWIESASANESVGWYIGSEQEPVQILAWSGNDSSPPLTPPKEAWWVPANASMPTGLCKLNRLVSQMADLPAAVPDTALGVAAADTMVQEEGAAASPIEDETEFDEVHSYSDISSPTEDPQDMGKAGTDEGKAGKGKGKAGTDKGKNKGGKGKGKGISPGEEEHAEGDGFQLECFSIEQPPAPVCHRPCRRRQLHSSRRTSLQKAGAVGSTSASCWHRQCWRASQSTLSFWPRSFVRARSDARCIA